MYLWDNSSEQNLYFTIFEFILQNNDFCVHKKSNKGRSWEFPDNMLYRLP